MRPLLILLSIHSCLSLSWYQKPFKNRVLHYSLPTSATRKHFLAPCQTISYSAAVLLSFCLLNIPQVVQAETPISTSNLATYANARFHTVVSYPTAFQMMKGSIAGDREVQAFIDPGDPDTSVSLVFTPIPADFSRLTSFGGKDGLRLYMLPKGEDVESTLIAEEVNGETYTIEYVVKSGASPAKHVISAFALSPKEFVAGLTIQSAEDTFPSKKDLLSGIVKTLKVDVGGE